MPTPSRRTFFSREYFWPLIIAALIFVASSRSRVMGVDVPQSDKIAHFAVYGLLATLVCRSGRGSRLAIWAVVVTSLYGASDEWHQSFVPGRSSQVADWVADTIGAALAVVLYTRWKWYREWLESPLGRISAFRKSHGRSAGQQSVPHGVGVPPTSEN